MRRRFLLKLALSATTALLAAPLAVSAADYPSKPITIVAPYGPGGSADLAARSLSSTASSYLGQPIMVVNRAGAWRHRFGLCPQEPSRRLHPVALAGGLQRRRAGPQCHAAV